jgi:hypothetical protein
MPEKTQALDGCCGMLGGKDAIDRRVARYVIRKPKQNKRD